MTESSLKNRRAVLMVSQNSGPYGSVQSVITGTIRWMTQNTDWSIYAANISPQTLPEDNPYIVQARCFGATIIQYETRSKFSTALIRHLVKDIHERNVCTTHGHGYKSDVHLLLAARFCKVPFLSTLHTWTEHDWKDRLYSRIDQWILRYADLCIAVSDGMKRIAVSKGIPAEKITVVHNWVNVIEIEENASKSSVTRSELGLQESDRVFLVPARLSPEKGHLYLMKAIRSLVSRYPRIKLLFAGEGYYRPYLEEYVRQQGLEPYVLFLGYRKDIHRIMQISDWVVLPSFKEGLPLALLEAMALKKPIIATNVSGVPEIVQHEQNGFLVAAGDVEALSAAVEKALLDEEMGVAYGLKGYEIVIEQFNPEVQVPKIVHIYEELVSRRQTSP